MPKVSICVPTYNNLTCVEYLCASIAQQTFEDYEVIITDDSTNMEIENFILKDCIIPKDKIHYYHNEKPLGHIFNWNCALEKATGEYVKIMFSDDWFTFPDSLKKMVDMLEQNSNVLLAFSGSRQVKESAAARDRYASEKYIENITRDYRYLFLGNEIGAPSAVIFRNGNYRFVEESNWASDMFLYFYILQNNPRFTYTKEPLISIMEHEEQYTNLFTEYDDRKINDYMLMYEKYKLQDFIPARDYFLCMILRYKKPFSYAECCGYKKKEYRIKRKHYIKEYVIYNYLHVIQDKITKPFKKDKF